MAWVWDLWRSNALLALGIVLFLGGLGVPGPATLAIVATGALVRMGGVSPLVASLVGLACAATGDLLSYGIARRGLGRWMERRKRKPSWQKAVKRFEGNAMLTLFLARWLFTPISMPTTYIAGSSRYPLTRFLAASLAGQAVWIALYGAIGYGLGRRWKAEAGEILHYAEWGFGVLFVVGTVVFLMRRRSRRDTAPLPEG